MLTTSDTTLADLPPKVKIGLAASKLLPYLERGITAVYLNGYGAHRDWQSGVGEYFTKIIGKNKGPLVVKELEQRDKAIGGVRYMSKELMRKPESVRVPNADNVLIVESTIKEVNSPSYLGLIYFVLRNYDRLGLDGSVYGYVTEDHFGYADVSAEETYRDKGRVYRGTQRFVQDFAPPTIRDRLKPHLHRIGVIDPSFIKRIEDIYANSLKMVSSI